MSDNLNSQTLSSFTTFTKEDFLARAVAAQDQLRQQNPDLIEDELDLKLSTGRWEKAFMLPAATEVCVAVPLYFFDTYLTLFSQYIYLRII